MIKACKLKMRVLFDFIFNNIPTETQSPIVKQILMISLGQIIEYAPEDQQETLFNEFFDFLYTFIQKAKDVGIVKEITQTLIDSAYKKENIDKLLTWLDAGSVLNEKGEKIENTNLT